MEDQLKCLIFIAGLHSSQDVDIMLDCCQSLAVKRYHSVSPHYERQRLLGLNHDTLMLHQGTKQSTTSSRSDRRKNSFKKRLPASCRSCIEWHYSYFCLFKKENEDM